MATRASPGRIARRTRGWRAERMPRHGTQQAEWARQSLDRSSRRLGRYRRPHGGVASLPERPRWHGPPVWVHGDLHPGNLLAREGALHAVIDFGCVAVGEPAVDSWSRGTFPTTIASAFGRSSASTTQHGSEDAAARCSSELADSIRTIPTTKRLASSTESSTTTSVVRPPNGRAERRRRSDGRPPRTARRERHAAKTRPWTFRSGAWAQRDAGVLEFLAKLVAPGVIE
jgi:hypothetical protein